MHFQNQGNIVQTNVAMQDTLPLYTSFIAAQTGIFKSMTIDSTQRIVHWSMDTLAVSANDSVWMTLRVGRNVPDSTFIHNISWFGSSQLAFQSSETKTLVRSAPAMSLKNFIIDAKDSVIAGDSVKFEIWYQNVGTDSLRNVELVDSLFNAGRSILRYQNWSTGQPGKDTTVVDSIVTWKIGSVAPGSVDSLTLTMRTDYALLSGKTIQTTAYLVQNGVAVLSSSASVAVKSNPQFSTFLQVQKNADKNVAEIGDVVTYQVSVSNTSPGLMKSLTIIDQLPHSFKYYPHSGRYNNIPVDPQPLSGGAVLKWPLASIGRDSLNGGGTGVLVYQLVLGADALESQGINIAYATAKDASDTTRVFVSAPAQKQITVQPGVFTENGVIIGKVFYDDDRNAYQSEGETGIKGVEIWMEDGTRIVTGDDGKFSLPNVKAGQHVLRVNERSLPPGTELLKGGHDFAGDATSRFVRLPEGGIARANFFVKRVLRDSVHQRVGKVSKAAAMRTASPEKVYLQDVPAGASKTNIVEFGVHFNYSGGMWLQRILVFDDLPQGFSYVEGSALFNGRKVIPAIDGRHLLWSLGRGPSIFDGTLQYRVAVQRPEAQNSGLESHSVVELMTSDSVIIRSDTLTTTTSVQKISYVEKDFPVESLVFDPGKTSLRKNALAIFEPIVNLIKKYRYAEIMLVGYPDIPVKKDASLPSLQRLASERAKVALDFLSRRMKLDSVHIVPCGVFQCDTGKNVLETMMAGGSGSTIPPRHLEIRVQNYFLNALVERDTNTSMSAISLVRTLPESEKEFADSIFVIPGDDLLFSYALFSNPSSAVLGASVIDSTADKLSVESSSFTLNHIPIISAGEYKGVFSSSITPLIRKGSNVMQFEASIPSNSPNSQIEHTFYYERVNGFGETTIERSNPVTIYVRDKNLSLLNTALQRERTLAGTEGPPKSTTSK
ncbi:MAG TPA: hypothetical protein VMM58_10275, partial [Bacteroidota bacterium]|nr:hypothetical protein [Bacteroidota bacterium]